MTDAGVSLIVIAKEPVPGRVKTRLGPMLSPAQSAEVAEAAIADTLATVAAIEAPRRILALDGRPGEWLPRGFEVVPQCGGGLGARLAAAFEAVGGPALLVGMDTPQLTSRLLRGAVAKLVEPGVDAVLGPSEDGGYWAIGLRGPDRRVFDGVPMSSSRTGEEQRRRLAELDLRVGELPVLRDVDTYADARAVARLCPRSRFAAAFAGVRLMRPAER